MCSSRLSFSAGVPTTIAIWALRPDGAANSNRNHLNEENLIVPWLARIRSGQLWKNKYPDATFPFKGTRIANGEHLAAPGPAMCRLLHSLLPTLQSLRRTS
jgi:hypothetical protein